LFFKLEQSLFYLLLFSIPFQIRKILYYPGWVFNEWLSISIYATDILLIILFIFWLANTLTQKGKMRPTLKIHDYFLFAFVVISAISIKNTSALYLSGYHLLKLIEFVLFYFYVKTYAIQRFNFSRSLLALIAGGAFQAIIAIIQFLKQSDIGLRLLGEGLLDPQMRGISVA